MRKEADTVSSLLKRLYRGISEKSNTRQHSHVPCPPKGEIRANHTAPWSPSNQLHRPLALQQPRAGLASSPDKYLQWNHSANTEGYAWTDCSLPQVGPKPLAVQAANQPYPGSPSRRPLTAQNQLWELKGPTAVLPPCASSGILSVMGKLMGQDTFSHISGEAAWKPHDLSGKQLGNADSDSWEIFTTAQPKTVKTRNSLTGSTTGRLHLITWQCSYLRN